MRKLITLALLISASVTAQAKLGETREQIIQRFSQQAMTDSGANYMEFVGKNYVFVFFGAAGRSTTEIYQMKTAYSAADANEIAKTVLGGMRWRWQQVKMI